MKLNRIHHVAIICSDYKRSRAFYTSVLGVEIIEETYRSERDSYKLDLRMESGDQIEIFSFHNRPDRPSYPEALGLRHLAFEVDDIDQTIAELEAMGVKVEDIRTDALTGKRFTFFEDPDKLPLELYEK